MGPGSRSSGAPGLWRFSWPRGLACGLGGDCDPSVDPGLSVDSELCVERVLPLPSLDIESCSKAGDMRSSRLLWANGHLSADSVH
mmetsp:Transcript_91977/g.274471  ORF Transcript_91977/g.274471 Transcript_91977/m.274471 type:complete len:85 (+) Transcript_91977:737-991(+)